MAKESDRSQDRIEEAFGNLSAEQGEDANSGGGRVWKIATLLLLLVALALPMAFGIRESRRSEEREVRIAAAREEAKASLGLIEEGKPGAAAMALDRAIGSLEDIPGTTRVAGEIHAELQRNKGEIERIREDLNRRRSVTASQIKALDALLRGNADAAASLLPAGAQTDPVSRSLLVLTRRMARWNLAAGETTGRSSALDMLAKDWHLPALLADRDRARVEDQAKHRVQMRIREALAAISAENFEIARLAVWDAFEARGLKGADDLLADLDRQKLSARARDLEAQGDLSDAAAIHRFLWVAYRVPGAHEKVKRLELSLAKDAEHTLLDRLLTKSLAEGDNLKAAVLTEIVRERSGKGPSSYRDFEQWPRWLTERAYEHFRDRAYSAALAWGEEAAREGHAPAKELVAAVEEEMAKERRSAALKAVDDLLKFDSVGYASILLLRAGEVPRGLFDRLTAAERREAIDRAARAIFLGDGKTALELLEKADLFETDAAATYVARALFLEGRIQAGLDLLPEVSDTQVEELLRAASLLSPGDREGFASLIGKALEISGPRPDLQAVLASALGDGEQEKEVKKLWAAVRDFALERAPLEK